MDENSINDDYDFSMKKVLAKPPKFRAKMFFK
jgi:hypothetical protein